MVEVRQTKQFAKWLAGLKDHQAQTAIAKRIRRIEGGLPADVKPVGEGCRRPASTSTRDTGSTLCSVARPW